VYFTQTRPLIEYYSQQGKLVEVDGLRPIEQVTESMLEALGVLQALERMA
jgi:adenylate kinase